MNNILKKKVVIKNISGLHFRPAQILVNEAKKYNSRIVLKKDGIEFDGKMIMSVLAAKITYGTKIELIVEGEDEKEAFKKIEYLIMSGMGELI